MVSQKLAGLVVCDLKIELCTNFFGWNIYPIHIELFLKAFESLIYYLEIITWKMLSNNLIFYNFLMKLTVLALSQTKAVKVIEILLDLITLYTIILQEK